MSTSNLRREGINQEPIPYSVGFPDWTGVALDALNRLLADATAAPVAAVRISAAAALWRAPIRWIARRSCALVLRGWLAMASAFAWVIAAGAIARFIFDSSARRGDTFGAGVVLAMSGCLRGLAAIWALARRTADENVESQPAVEPKMYR